MAQEPSTEALNRDDPGAFQSFRLRVVGGPERGRVVEASSDRLLIGTHRSNDLVLRDRTVSRFHCELKVSAGWLTVVDLGSSNGTIVDGVNVTGARLAHGARLKLGRTELRVELGTTQMRTVLSKHEHFGRMVGRSVPMRAAFAVLEQAARSNATVLLVGETGVGKDLAAEMLHAQGPRAQGPLMIVDCDALPPVPLESELFGHERGAVPGATVARAGAFEGANGGTLLLNEVGELSTDLQLKVFRAIETREVRRVGGGQRTAFDARIIATTSRNLWHEVNAGRFRADLYYKLAVIRVSLPPLRDRLEDLRLLVDALLVGMGAAGHARADKLRSEAFITELSRHRWPGNVRELRAHIERCLTIEADLPFEEDLGTTPTIDAQLTLSAARSRWLRAFERRYAEALLHAHDDNVSAAARAAGVDRTTFHRLLVRCGLTGTARRGRVNSSPRTAS